MAGLGNIVQKAFLMGVGLASYAGEKANTKFQELRDRAQKLADEMVKRGEMTAEEASKFVDDLMERAQQEPVESSTTEEHSRQPRRIEILDEDPPSTGSSPSQAEDENADRLRQQVEALQDELRRLQKD
ncbi:MAG: phasin family protein [Cyanobacteriota bacterium]|nr:phasin family protein [Cyanobacteriota bacterium]